MDRTHIESDIEKAFCRAGHEYTKEYKGKEGYSYSDCRRKHVADLIELREKNLRARIEELEGQLSESYKTGLNNGIEMAAKEADQFSDSVGDAIRELSTDASASFMSDLELRTKVVELEGRVKAAISCLKTTAKDHPRMPHAAMFIPADVRVNEAIKILEGGEK